jgi:lipopolysaccharide heptosyltransferase II
LIKPSSLGDIVHTLPFLHALRLRFPNAHLSWLVKSEWAPLLEGHPELDELLPVRFRVGEIGRLFRAVRRDFDWMIDLQGLFRTGFLSRLSGAAVRIGLSDAREGSRFFYTHIAPIPKEPLHAVERYLLAGRLFGLQEAPRAFVLPDLSKAALSLGKLVQSRKIPEELPWVAFHVGAREAPKRWPAERFAFVADALIRERKIAALFIGAKPERKEVEGAIERMARTAYNLAGETELLSLAALLSRVDLLICNDSGPMHLAAALGTPVAAIFGPTDPRKVGPYGEGHRVFKSDVDCSPCSRSRCVQAGACMAAISAQEVAGAARSLLEISQKGR